MTSVHTPDISSTVRPEPGRGRRTSHQAATTHVSASMRQQHDHRRSRADAVRGAPCGDGGEADRHQPREQRRRASPRARCTCRRPAPRPRPLAIFRPISIDEAVEEADDQEPRQPVRRTGQAGDAPVARRRVEIDQRHDHHVRRRYVSGRALQPVAAKNSAHQRDVDPCQQQEPDQRPVEPEREQQLRHAGRHRHDAKLAERHQAARHRAIRPVARIFLEILELVGDAQLQEEQQRRQERDRHRPERGPRRVAADQREKQTADTLNAATSGPCASRGNRSR